MSPSPFTTTDLGFANPLQLDCLEVAAGGPSGIDQDGDPLPTSNLLHPIAALEAASLAALRRPPTVVLFSGGRDSSAVLAVATNAARRHGLADPVPLSLRFRTDPDTEETEWQEMVIRHLGLKEWTRLDVAHELDLLGDRACTILERHGLLWPTHSYLHDLACDHATGGSVMSGLFGDAVFTPVSNRQHVRDILARRRRPTPRDVLRLGLAAAPRAIRHRIMVSRNAAVAPPWLDEQASRELRSRRAADLSRTGISWHSTLNDLRRRRSIGLAERSIEMLTAGRGVRFVAPLGDAEFLAAVAAHRGPGGYRTRTDAMEQIFAGVLPEAVIGRRSKARFRWSYWGPATAAFAESWDGSGLPSFVDADIVRKVWTAITQTATELPLHAGMASLPLHAAWLGSRHNIRPGR